MTFIGLIKTNQDSIFQLLGNTPIPVSEACINLVTKNLTSNKYDSIMLANSGKYLNELGNKEQCNFNNDIGMQYYTAVVALSNYTFE